MSRFFSSKYSSLVPYTPGEQPRDSRYIKLNTNESPFPPSQAVINAIAAESGKLQLYSDPDSRQLVEKLAEVHGVRPQMIAVGNGSDEILNFAFMAFGDRERPLAFPDISYGFYPVFAELNNIPYTELPLDEDFSIRPEDYENINRTIVIANPNAPTGLCLSLSRIEHIARTNPDNVVVIDEAYVDFGGESAIKLTEKLENLLVVRTFSKSHSLAGARLGYAVGNEALIADINTLRCSTNPYNVNRMSCAAGYVALCDNGYYMDNCAVIAKNRQYTSQALKELGFEVLPSKANFIFARTDDIGGEALYLELKRQNILVRHFSKPRIDDFIRVSIGTMEQMLAFLEAVRDILEEQ